MCAVYANSLIAPALLLCEGWSVLSSLFVFVHSAHCHLHAFLFALFLPAVGSEWMFFFFRREPTPCICELKCKRGEAAAVVHALCQEALAWRGWPQYDPAPPCYGDLRGPVRPSSPRSPDSSVESSPQSVGSSSPSSIYSWYVFSISSYFCTSYVTSLLSPDLHPSLPSPKTFLEPSYAPYGRLMPDPGYGIDALLDDMSDEEAREWRRHNIHSTCARFRVEAGKSCVFPSTAALERVVFPEHFSDTGTETK